MENPIKMDDLGVPLFSETPIYSYIFLLSAQRWPPRGVEDMLQKLRILKEILAETFGEKTSGAPSILEDERVNKEVLLPAFLRSLAISSYLPLNSLGNCCSLWSHLKSLKEQP